MPITLTGGLDNDAFTQVFNVSDVMCINIVYTTSGAISTVDFCYDNPLLTCDLVAPLLGPDVEVCAGTDPGPISVTAPASSTSTAPITYQWQQSLLDCVDGFGNISGATSATYNPGPLVATTHFRVIAMTDDGSIVCVEESNCITYTTTNNPVVEINPIGTVCLDDGVVIAEATPDGGTFSGNGIVNTTNGTFDPVVAGIGSHTITYTFNMGPCSGMATQTIVVEENPVILCETNLFQGAGWEVNNCNRDICEGTDVGISAAPVNGGVGYSWVGPNGYTSSSRVNTLTAVTLAMSGVYTVTYVDPNTGCESSREITLNIIEAPQATATATNATCGSNDGSITFTFPDNPNRTNIEFSLDGGATYPHNFLDTNSPSMVTGLASGTYDLWVRWGNDECPVDLPDVTIGVNNVVSCFGIQIVRN